jgi:hypothetical protein
LFFEIFRDFQVCFWAPHAEKRQKNAIKKIEGKRRQEKSVFSSLLFRPKTFDMDSPKKAFDGVFELPLVRNAQKRHKKVV